MNLRILLFRDVTGFRLAVTGNELEASTPSLFIILYNPTPRRLRSNIATYLSQTDLLPFLRNTAPCKSY